MQACTCVTGASSPSLPASGTSGLWGAGPVCARVSDAIARSDSVLLTLLLRHVFGLRRPSGPIKSGYKCIFFCFKT